MEPSPAARKNHSLRAWRRGTINESDRSRPAQSRKVIEVDEGTVVEEIASLMTHHNIKRAPVMAEGKLLGIVSRADIIRAVAMGKHIALHTPVYDL